MVFRGLGDAFATQVLQAQIPALRQGVKILIQDVVMPEPEAIPLWKTELQLEGMSPRVETNHGNESAC
jgi:hypothetical protein